MNHSRWSERTIKTVRLYRGEDSLKEPIPEPHRTLLEVSPDFGVMTDEYPVGNVMARPGLPMRERSMTIMATLLANRYEFVANGHMNWALNIGITREEVLEIIVQVAPYTSWPVGAEIFELVERAYPGYLKTAGENPFRKVWAQPQLSLRERTMITMAALIARRFSDRLKAHLHYALDIGITREEILETIMQVTPFSGWPVGVEAICVAKDVFAAKE